MIKQEKHLKIIYWVSIFSFFAGVLPFLVLSFYTFPNLEDYAESIIPEVWWHVKFLYLTYDGRYFASFLFAAFNPLKFKSFLGYQFIPFSLIILLFFSLFLFIKAYLKKSGFLLTLLLSSIVLVLFLLNNPSPSYSFYYMISSYVYLMPSILFIFLMVFLKWFYETRISYIRSFWGFLSALCIIAIAGSNEILLIPLAFVVVVFSIFALKKSMVDVFLLWVAIVASFFIVLTSPGLLEDFELRIEPDRNLTFHFQSILKTVQFSHKKIILWLFDGVSLWLILLFLVSILLLNKDALHQSLPNFSVKAIFSWVLFFGTTSLLIVFPYVWAAGDMAVEHYYQAFIIPYFYFHLGLVITTVLIVNNLTYKINFTLLNFPFQTLSLGLLLLTVLSVAIENNRINTAYKDWLSGTASAYSQEMKRNIQASLDADQYNKENKPTPICILENNPSTIFSGMYFTAENEDFHGQYKMFFKINAIQLKECK